MSDIKLAVETLADRHAGYVNAEDYYRGSEREVFVNARWNRALKSYGLDYVLNYCGIVVDTVLNRLEIASVQGTNEASNKALNEIWEQNEMILDSTEIHRRALTYGDCYAIVWPDDEGEVQITYNSPLTTVLIYDEENPRIKSYAAKMWQSTNSFGKKIVRLNLYYPDRVEKFWRDGEISYVPGDENSWNRTGTVENPWGEVPVFHFRTHRPYGTPEHAPGIGAQDAINKLVVNHMETVDYQGAPQRYALSNFGNESEGADPFEDDDTARENIAALQNHPGNVWFMNGVSQVGQFSPADHKQFTEPIQAYVEKMASLTNTPLHYFKSNGVVVSGEAYRHAESPLIKKVRARQLSFGSTWRDLFRFALKIQGIDVDVQVKWAGVESIDATDTWNVALQKKALGLPLKMILTEMGYDEELAGQIAEEAEAKQVQVQENPSQLGQGLNAHNLALQEQAKQD